MSLPQGMQGKVNMLSLLCSIGIDNYESQFSGKQIVKPSQEAPGLEVRLLLEVRQLMKISNKRKM